MSELRQRGAAQQQTTRHQQRQQAAAVKAEDVKLVSPAAAETTSSLKFVLACLLLLLPIRMLSALFMPILDCDETFNYWEPLHYLMFGRGLQTWEYSPAFGLRSYAYLYLISPIAWIMKSLHDHSGGEQQQEVNKRHLFFAIRLSFAVACALIETRLLRTVRRVLGSSIARWMLLFLALSAGMSHAAPAFLPQTFTLMFVMMTLDAWLSRRYAAGIFFTGVSCLVGWPFSVLLSLPLAVEILYVFGRRRGGLGALLRGPVCWGLLSAAVCVLPCLAVDYAYFRRVVFAVVNIAIYNSNSTSEHGANLYGKEPAMFYVHNLALNFNVAAPLAILAPVVLLLARVARGGRASAGSVSEAGVLRWLLPLYLWLGIFFAMPHKEERFLFVVYPYIALAAAVTTFVVMRMLQGCYAPFALVNWPNFKRASSSGCFRRSVVVLAKVGLVFLFASLSLSRSLNLIINYRAPMRVWSAVHERARDSATNAALLPFPLPLGPDPDARAPGVDASVVPIVAAADAQVPELVNVCVGKEWYRFPAHFLLPTVRLPSSSSSSSPSPSPSSGQRQMDWTLRFLESDFGGLLPKTYLQQWEWEAMQKQPQQQQQSATATDAQLQARSALFPPESPLHAWFPHLVSRPGTWVLPSHMNDFNRREDGGRFLRPEQCHYIVDLSLPAGEQREPAWEKQQVRLAQPVQLQGRCVAGWEWRVVFSDPFLDSAASPHPLLRAFWLPPYSTRSNVMRPYQLLERVPIFCSSTTGGV